MWRTGSRGGSSPRQEDGASPRPAAPHPPPPRPAVVAPEITRAVAAIAHEHAVLAVRHERVIDAERRHLDVVRWPLVVVRPRVAAPHRERARRDEDIAVGLDRGQGGRAKETGEGKRLPDRLRVLKLVLHDHADQDWVEV